MPRIPYTLLRSAPCNILDIKLACCGRLGIGRRGAILRGVEGGFGEGTLGYAEADVGKYELDGGRVASAKRGVDLRERADNLSVVA